MPLRPLLAGIALVGAACATSQRPTATYPPRTTVVLARSARCEGRACRCRALDSDNDQAEQNVPSGHKRFELRLPRSPSAIWVAVKERGVYYKAPEVLDPACFYVDLPPGLHEITIHAEDRDAQVGLQAGLTIHEYGDKVGPNWYRSFSLACGHGASRCTIEELDAWQRVQRTLPRGVLDPCGSVMVQKVRFGGARAERLDRAYKDLTVRFALEVYEFEPHRPAGSPKCTGPTPNR